MAASKVDTVAAAGALPRQADLVAGPEAATAVVPVAMAVVAMGSREATAAIKVATAAAVTAAAVVVATEAAAAVTSRAAATEAVGEDTVVARAVDTASREVMLAAGLTVDTAAAAAAALPRANHLRLALQAATGGLRHQSASPDQVPPARSTKARPHLREAATVDREGMRSKRKKIAAANESLSSAHLCFRLLRELIYNRGDGFHSRKSLRVTSSAAYYTCADFSCWLS